ncbi:MAG: response regulator [Bacteriovorax sp.]|nr:response regulator [Bacteriovorax sp.]
MSQAAAAGNISKDFVSLIDKVSSVVHKISGNRLGEKQAYMVETRVKKRMMELGLKTPDDYIKYIDAHFDNESYILVGLITTHHTFFFREFPHFEILKNKLPELISHVKKRGDKTLSVWSAACSKGHEVYSLAMFLDLYIPQIDPTISFKILGTDIDGESVKIAGNGVYHHNEIKEIPMTFMGDNWAKGTGDIAMYAKVKTKLKSKCEFRPGNLLKVNEVVKNEKFDVIFCRNVFIYFETHQVESISKELINRLQPHGIYFSGISEPLSGMKLDIASIGPSAYTHKSAVPAPMPAAAGNVLPMRTPTPVSVPPALLRVMCVDDSPSILTLLKKVLAPEFGFEIVATAVNGVDAMEKLKTVKVDLMTLDIHMPEMDGVTYLEKNHNKSHPPVMIISSASRADSDTAMRAFKFGASDYVEKPALINLEERGEEIRTKLRTIAGSAMRSTVVSSFDKDNQKTFVIANPEKKMRLILGALSDLPMLKSFFHDMDNSQPPTIVFFEGAGEILESIVREHQRDFKKAVVFFEGMDTKLEANKIYFADFKKYFPELQKKHGSCPTSILAYGNTSAHAAKMVKEWKGCELLIEDLGEKANMKHSLKSSSNDVVPATSFPYMSCKYLSMK